MTSPAVFIVEQDPWIRSSISLLLETADLPSQGFACAEDFLSTCGVQPTGCLLMDVSLPGMNPTQLQDELTLRRIDLPILFFTADADAPTATSTLQQDVIDVLAQPVNGARLLRGVESALERHR